MIAIAEAGLAGDHIDWMPDLFHHGPGATATGFWDVAGYAAQKHSAITMSAEDAVDAALAGLDQDELVTIPGLHNGEAWTRWKADRREISKKIWQCQAGAALWHCRGRHLINSD